MCRSSSVMARLGRVGGRRAPGWRRCRRPRPGCLPGSPAACVAARQASLAAAATRGGGGSPSRRRPSSCCFGPWAAARRSIPGTFSGLAGQFPLHEPGGESLPDPRVEDLVGDDRYDSRRLCGGRGGRRALAGDRGHGGGRGGRAREAGRLVGQARHHHRLRHPASLRPRVSRDRPGRCSRPSAASAMRLRRRRRRDSGGSRWPASVRPAATPRRPRRCWPRVISTARRACSCTGRRSSREPRSSGPVRCLAGGGRALAGPGPRRPLACRPARVRRFLELVEANTSGVVDLLEAAAVGREPGEAPTMMLVAAHDDDDESRRRGAGGRGLRVDGLAGFRR